jgi:RsiW-degrading membrane proteinase PrsW (M82 family)
MNTAVIDSFMVGVIVALLAAAVILMAICVLAWTHLCYRLFAVRTNVIVDDTHEDACTSYFL